MISFPLLLGGFFAIVFWPGGGPYLFLAASTLMIYAVTFELLKVVERLELPSFPKMTGIAVALFFLLTSLHSMRLTPSVVSGGLLLLVLLLYLGWVGLLFGRDRAAFFKKFLVSLGVGVVMIATFIPLVLVYFHPFGPLKLLFLVLVTKMMDTGGYIAGMLSAKYLPGGNHKIAPAISPKKSWEGLGGGLLLSMTAALVFYGVTDYFEYRGFWWCAAAGLLLAAGSFAGDLTESALKRAGGVKDSGGCIPGMGGVFDVLDSFIYNGILFFILTRIF